MSASPQPSRPPAVREIQPLPYRGPEPGIAILLELLPGFLFQTFGIGNLYAGNRALGLFIMLSYWVFAFFNFLLCFVLIGLITWPLTWIAYAAGSSILASRAASARSRSY